MSPIRKDVEEAEEKEETPSDSELQSIIEEGRHTDDDLELRPYKGNAEKMISTGSTTLDLAISGLRVRGGGIPGGIMIEIFGPSSAGKTAVLSEILASVQMKRGQTMILDPEARMDQLYSKIFDLELDKKNYHMPDTVSEVFKLIEGFKPEFTDEVNAIGIDSLAALSSEMEMSDKGDKMGMRIAKDFSQGCRKTCRIIRKNNWIIPCTNQIRSGSGSDETTPGGKGVEFYSSLRIRIGPPKQGKYLTRGTTFKATPDSEGTKQEKTYGIKSICTVKKSSVDEPYRTADVYIIFGYGIDDVRGNLQYCKDVEGTTRYDCSTKQFQIMERAIDHIEENNLRVWLKDKTIDLWERIQKQLENPRKGKVRG